MTRKITPSYATEGFRGMADDQRSHPPFESWFARILILRWIVPLAFSVILAGCAMSIGIRADGWPATWDDLVLSNLASRKENPTGWLVAVVSTTLGGILLLSSAALLVGAFRRIRSGWGILGALLYCLGVLAIITWAISTPLTVGPSSFHVYLSYFAYMSSVGGLGICHSVIALMPNPVRAFSLGSFVLLSATFLVIIYFFFHDSIFDRHFWLLAVSEWVAGFLVVSTTTALAYGVVRLTKAQMDTEQEQALAQQVARGNAAEPRASA
jgi:hypothetical protein